MKTKPRALLIARLTLVVAALWPSSSLDARQRVAAEKHAASAARARHSAPATRTAQPVVLRESVNAASLGGAALPYRILLPADYATSARRYPVLYLLHGAQGGEGDWTTRTNLAAYAARYQLIVVMPGVGDSWYANSASDEKARYEDAIIRDLIPHVDEKYRTLASGYGRAVAGLSMGGFGAMKFALSYPQLFVFAASFSGAFDAPRTNIIVGAKDERSQILLRVFGAADSETRRRNDVFELARAVKEGARVPYLYVSTGNNDPLASVLPANTRFAEALRERKIAYEYHERPGAHEWRFWDAEIKLALERMSDFVAHMKPDARF
ncbi:MAG: esterase family protein [Acidobacteria bacterium]|nr:esterase family protein [Acidobacteriota bacterium]